jgi:hypothetical protein
MPTPTTKFAMKLPEGMVARLAATEWGRRIFDYRQGKDHLFIAVRDRYLSVYINGRAVFKKVEEKNGRLVALFDQRYLYGKDHPSGDLCFDGEKIFRKGNESGRIESEHSPRHFAAWVHRVRSYDLVDLGDEKVSSDPEDVSEKGSLARHALDPAVINLEMALPGFPSVSKKTGKEILIAPRIDMVRLEQTGAGAELVFIEAKLFSNGALRSASSENPTVNQIRKYRDYLDRHRDSICLAYVQACKHLVEIRRHQGVEIHPLLSGVAGGTVALSLRELPELLIFKPSRVPEISEKAWKAHERSIEEIGIKIEYG